ncbi:MAG: PorP/SprF family type IX secretion system membrane protein [Lishizhenia sp.]
MNKRIVFSAVLSCLVLSTKAQDITFSQVAQTPLVINPALTGVFDGWERVTANHRSQWIGANTSFQTTSLSADLTIGKKNINDRAHLGLGLFMYNDVGGNANFGTKSAAMSLSGILPVGGGHTLSAGLQAGVGFRNGFIHNLTFENQWNGTEFDPDLPNGELGSLNSFIYPDISAGFNWMYDAKKSTFSRNENTKFMLGFAVFHANNPALEYTTGFSEQLYRKFVVHTSFSKEISRSNWVLDANAIQFFQGPHYQTMLGLIAKNRLSSGTKLTGNKQDSYIGFGLQTRIKDAIIPTMLLELKGFSFVLSYDITLSALRNTNGGGTLELSLTYRNLNHALFKRRRYY